ncbi:MAG: tRNA pseudouridine(55) synthase TruB [Planctomycetota bacterium]|nr:tRNA pseudouridine(55) synthase TruB [Planctomycetota bacterium]
MTEPPPLDGLLLIDKHVGPTSMQVCANIRRRLREGGAPKRVKVGHAGTLDPLASGLLVVLVGRATRLCDLYMAGEKAYVAQVDLSANSATDDAEGERTPVDVPVPPTRGAVERALTGFVGTILQTPPVYSAVHVDGRRAYALARAGTPPQLLPRPVFVSALRLTDFAWPIATVEIECGKGFYVRSLARDLGRALGVGGLLASLRRTRVGAFSVGQAVRIADLPNAMDQSHLAPARPGPAPLTLPDPPMHPGSTSAPPASP